MWISKIRRWERSWWSISVAGNRRSPSQRCHLCRTPTIIHPNNAVSSYIGWISHCELLVFIDWLMDWTLVHYGRCKDNHSKVVVVESSLLRTHLYTSSILFDQVIVQQSRLWLKEKIRWWDGATILRLFSKKLKNGFGRWFKSSPKQRHAVLGETFVLFLPGL